MLGVRWVSVDGPGLARWLARGGLEPSDEATEHTPVGWWLEQVDSPEARARACALGAEVVEGAEPSRQARHPPQGRLLDTALTS